MLCFSWIALHYYCVLTARFAVFNLLVFMFCIILDPVEYNAGKQPELLVNNSSVAGLFVIFTTVYGL